MAHPPKSHAAEGQAFCRNNSKNIARFLLEQIICQYGHIVKIITDNGAEFKGATEVLLRRYGIPQIKIMPYNKHSTGVVEYGHFTIHQVILKNCG